MQLRPAPIARAEATQDRAVCARSEARVRRKRHIRVLQAPRGDRAFLTRVHPKLTTIADARLHAGRATQAGIGPRRTGRPDSTFLRAAAAARPIADRRS